MALGGDKLMAPCLIWGWISTTCAIPISSKWKCTYMFAKINTACRGLNDTSKVHLVSFIFLSCGKGATIAKYHFIYILLWLAVKVLPLKIQCDTSLAIIFFSLHSSVTSLFFFFFYLGWLLVIWSETVISSSVIWQYNLKQHHSTELLYKQLNELLWIHKTMSGAAAINLLSSSDAYMRW